VKSSKLVSDILDLTTNNNSKNIKLCEGVVGGREVPAGGFLSGSRHCLLNIYLWLLCRSICNVKL
jgi:hypothetical protein